LPLSLPHRAGRPHGGRRRWRWGGRDRRREGRRTRRRKGLLPATIPLLAWKTRVRVKGGRESGGERG
jgi:hypothetical protein